MAPDEIIIEPRLDSRLRDIEADLYGTPQNRGGIVGTVRGMDRKLDDIRKLMWGALVSALMALAYAVLGGPHP